MRCGVWIEADETAFIALTTPDYAFNSAGTADLRDERATGLAAYGGFEVQQVGDLIVMGEGPTYAVAEAETIHYGDTDYGGASVFRVIETEDGLKIAEPTWVGDL